MTYDTFFVHTIIKAEQKVALKDSYYEYKFDTHSSTSIETGK